MNELERKIEQQEKYIEVREQEIEELNNIMEQIKEYIEYSLNNPLADERLILQMVLAKLKVELKGDNK